LLRMHRRRTTLWIRAHGRPRGSGGRKEGIDCVIRVLRPAVERREPTAQLKCAIVRRAIEAIWNDGDLDLADRLFARDYVNHGGLITDLVLGPEAIRISVALYRKAFPRFHITIASLTTLRGETMLRWIARGSPPDGLSRSESEPESAGLVGTMRLRFSGVRIAESWTDWDQAGVLASLGMIPSDRSQTGPQRFSA
jgi:hypothetical protein